MFLCVVQAQPSSPGLIPVRCWDQPAAPPTPGASLHPPPWGFLSPPGLFRAPVHLGRLVPRGFAENAWLLCVQKQSERDDLNHAAGSRSRLRRGVWSHPCLFHPGLAECPPAALSIPTPHSAKDPGCGAGIPHHGVHPSQLSWLQVPRFPPGRGPVTFIPLCPRLVRVVQVHTQFRDSDVGLLRDLSTAETWGRGIGITPQVKNDKDQTIPQHFLGHGQANCPAQPSCSPPKTPGKGKMLRWKIINPHPMAPGFCLAPNQVEFCKESILD